MKRSLSCSISRFTFAAMLVAFAAILPATAQPCVVPDNGGGTVDLPPPGCGYVSPDDLHIMIEGLPAGTTIRVAADHFKFFQVQNFPGGSLGGEVEQFQSILCMDLEGTGGLVLSRNICLQMQTETHTGPRNPGDPVQTFPTEMFLLTGELFGDPDFDFLRIEAGQGFGLPSPGETTLSLLPTGNFNVDSFFDISYTIEFVGAPGSVLAGRSGKTSDTMRMSTGEPAQDPDPCLSPDDGSGTAVLPPPNCPYLSPQDFHIAVANTSPDTELIIDAVHERFLDIEKEPGGDLGGDVETFTSSLRLDLRGTGALAGFRRTVQMSAVDGEVHTGPRNEGDPVQMFPNEFVRLQGEIFGDPDFDFLRIVAGSAFGLPSPGQTTLTRLGPPGSDFQVDSFFDIFYRIDFQGAPGSQLEGQNGSNAGTVRMQAGGPAGTGCPPIPPGDDIFPSTAKLVLQSFAGGPPIVLRLSSANMPDTIVRRSPQTGDTIPVQITQLHMAGNHPDVGGPVEVHLAADATQPSLGQITNIVQHPQTCQLISADSFFDVVVDIQLAGLDQTWTTDRPLHIEAQLPSLPPRNVKYENPFVDPVVILGPGPGLCSITPQTCINDGDCPVGEVCLPGPPQPIGEILYERHHVHPPFPPPGIDCFDTWLDAEIAIGPDDANAFPVQLQGLTSVERRQNATTGSWSTEILSMDLTGDTPLGKVDLKQSQQRRSAGELTSQQADSTFPVDSFFDVFVDVSLPAQDLALHNDQPVHVNAIGSSGLDGLTNLPPDPDSSFQGGDTCSLSGAPCNTNLDCPLPGEICGIPLVADDGTPVGSIRRVNHITHPPFDWQPPPPAEDYCFDSWIHLRITIFNPFCEAEVWLPGIFRIIRGDPQGIGAAIMRTLMAKAEFLGSSLCTGALSVQLDPDRPSEGQVTPLTPREHFPADSFFDVSARLDTGIGVLTPAASIPMTTTINNVPPDDGEIYFGPGQVIPIFDPTGLIIGEILEVAHQVHRRIECPFDHLSRIAFRLADVGGPGGASGSTEAVSAGETIFVTLPGGGGGLLYDVVGGDWSATAPFPSGFPGHACLQDNGSGVLVDPAPDPARGFGRYYVARELFDTFVGSWNGGGNQKGNRDLSIFACP